MLRDRFLSQTFFNQPMSKPSSSAAWLSAAWGRKQYSRPGQWIILPSGAEGYFAARGRGLFCHPCNQKKRLLLLTLLAVMGCSLHQPSVYAVLLSSAVQPSQASVTTSGPEGLKRTGRFD